MPERTWVDEFIHECCVFPLGAHDDDVDAFSQLVARCMVKRVTLDLLFSGSSSPEDLQELQDEVHRLRATLGLG